MRGTGDARSADLDLIPFSPDRVWRDDDRTLAVIAGPRQVKTSQTQKLVVDVFVVFAIDGYQDLMGKWTVPTGVREFDVLRSAQISQVEYLQFILRFQYVLGG